MNAAKTLVWVMSGMLLAGLAVLVVGLSLGWHQDSPPAISAQIEKKEFDLIDLGQPSGTVIEEISSSAGELAVVLSGGGLGPRILIVDTMSGAVRGEIITNSSDSALSKP